MLKNLRNIVKSWPKDPTKDSRDLGRALVGFVDRKYGNVEGNKRLMQQAEADSEALKKLLNGEARIAYKRAVDRAATNDTREGYASVLSDEGQKELKAPKKRRFRSKHNKNSNAKMDVTGS